MESFAEAAASFGEVELTGAGPRPAREVHARGDAPEPPRRRRRPTSCRSGARVGCRDPGISG